MENAALGGVRNNIKYGETRMITGRLAHGALLKIFRVQEIFNLDWLMQTSFYKSPGYISQPRQ